MIEYPEREYIQRLLTNSKVMLVDGDLPIGGALKEVSLYRSMLSSIKGSAIPFGVEILNYYSICNETTPFSTLPTSIHTINNAFISNAFILNNNENYNIPPNLTSISFRNSPNISGDNETYGNGFLEIPNTIKTLRFNRSWCNEGILLRKGDIPDSVTDISILGFNSNNISHGVLPNSVKFLEISYKNLKNNNNNHILPLPPSINIEKLYIETNLNITRECNLIEYITIKKLSIYFINSEPRNIEPNSLPPSLNELDIISISSKIEKDSIPSNVKTLRILTNNNPDVNFYSKQC